MGENPSIHEGNYYPVERVWWHQAMRFCEKLSEKTGQVYRLPTEAEWEYACRAGSTGQFCFGDQEEELDQYGWHWDTTRGTSQLVGKRRPNAWGLHDMHGNVWELCQDFYDQDYYAYSEEFDPQGPPFGDHRVLRGGSNMNNPKLCRSATRYDYPPDVLYIHTGFRLVVSSRTL